MTTDLVVDTLRNGRLVTLARAVKPAAELEKPRVLEKLEIERRWWTAQGIDWGILTERDIPMTMASAIFWVHEYGHLDGRGRLSDATVFSRQVVGWART